MPAAELIGLIHSLTAAGEAALGEWSPLKSRLERDGVAQSRQTAERSLRLLEVLQQKTRGNLDRVEADALTAAIATLKAALEEPQSPGGLPS